MDELRTNDSQFFCKEVTVMATQEQPKKEETKQTNEQQNKPGSQQLQTQSAGRRPSQQTGMARRSQFGSPSSSSPFTFMRRFSEEMDRLFDDFGFGGDWLNSGFERDFFPRSVGGFRESLWSPQIETFEREGQLVIRADLPGLKKDDVNVEITDNAITISGERRNEDEERREGYYRSERSYGSFFRSIPLPEGVDADDANATFENGVLEVTMQAPQLQSRGRRLEIKGTAADEQTRGKAAGR
jgi:HSP20 family protein